MATLRNKRKLAAINRVNHQGHPGIIPARKTNSLKIQEDYITQLLEEIEGRVTKKLSQEFRRRQSRILGASSRIDGFLNPPAGVHSRPVPETSRNSNKETRERIRITPRMSFILKWVCP